jgi:hypothetical protein
MRFTDKAGVPKSAAGLGFEQNSFIAYQKHGWAFPCKPIWQSPLARRCRHRIGCGQLAMAAIAKPR